MVILVRTLFILLCTLSTAQAALIASVSQQRISEGDTINLSITSTDGRSDQAPDFAALTRDFIILGQQENHSMSIANGQRSSTTTWQLSLLAKSLGELTIPSLTLKKDRSRPIAITVTPAAKNQTIPTAETVLIESSLSRNRIYLGGQSLLTVKIIHRGNMVNATLSEPLSDQANIVQTHEASYQRVIDGTPVAVIERVYAVFAEAEGEISISGQTLQAELALGSQRSIFGYSNTKTTRRNSQPQTLTVLALPEFAKDKDTVSADKLSFEQQWSSSTDDLHVGDSITRILRITATGATGAQIPPLFVDNINGIKIYGDQPELNDEKTQQGIIGSRTESTAYVLTQAGTYEVPAMVLHWVNTATGKVQSVSVPSTQLKVAPAVSTVTAQNNSANDQTAQNNNLSTVTPAPTVIVQPALQANVWFWVSVGLGFLWLLTLLLLLRTHRSSPTKADEAPAVSSSPKLFKQLILNAKTNDTSKMLTAFNQWGRSINNQLNNNQKICDFMGDEEITKSIQRAERSLYQAGDNAAWNGASLVSHLQQWQKQQAKAQPDQLRPLY